VPGGFHALAERLDTELITADERLFHALDTACPAVRFLGHLEVGARAWPRRDLVRQGPANPC